jgi:hypothetical protein
MASATAAKYNKDKLTIKIIYAVEFISGSRKNQLQL